MYYPTGARNFFRVIARQDLQGAAFAVLANRLRLKGVYLVHDAPEGIGKVVWADSFSRAAARLGVHIAGTARHQQDGSDDSLADRVARSGADGVLIGTVGDGGLLKALRARLGRRATIMAGDGFAVIPDTLEDVGRAARDLYVSWDSIVPDALDPNPARERFTRDFGDTAHGLYALHAAEAAEVVLQAIARSDGTRASVLREMCATSVNDGLLGRFRFDRHGDMTPAKVMILRITGSSPPDLRLPRMFQGAVVDRVVTVPASLAG
ncbi:MAG: ABC transporter substrate-binding protein [Solirubrobacteraceae bacterium]